MPDERTLIRANDSTKSPVISVSARRLVQRVKMYAVRMQIAWIGGHWLPTEIGC